MMRVDPSFADNFQQPLTTQTYSLSGDIFSILNASDVDDRTKFTINQQALSKYLNAHHKLVDELTAPIKVETVTREITEFLDDKILSSLLQLAYNDVEELLKRIKERISLGLDQKGRLLRDGSAVEGLQITELVENLVKKNKKSQPPDWNVFFTAVKNVWPPQTVERIPSPSLIHQQSVRMTKRKQKRKRQRENY